MPRLSAIVITRNEAANIGDCLDSLAFCDERIVVDSGSDDGTAAIAREKGARSPIMRSKASARRRISRSRWRRAIGCSRSMPTSA